MSSKLDIEKIDLTDWRTPRSEARALFSVSLRDKRDLAFKCWCKVIKINQPMLSQIGRAHV